MNMINKNTPNTNTSLIRWARISALLLGGACAGIGALHTSYTCVLRNAQHHRASLNTKLASVDQIVEKKRTLKQKREDLKNQIAKIERRTQHPKGPFKHVSALANVCKEPISINTLTLKKNHLDLHGSCANADQAHQLTRALNESALFTNTQLVSVRAQQNRTSFVITGNVIAA